jgi:DNA (cytosine-5)-methyltransferase 1
MKIKVIDLFAGIGGIRRGFENAIGKENVECVMSSEWDKYAVETYISNYPNEDVKGDITKIDEKDVPDHDLLMAGFPCQPFSQAGLRKGFEDTRGTLFFDILRILKKKKPKCFILENVKRLKTHDKGRTLETIISSLKEIGYTNVHIDILRARDFGLPQNRERVFIVGFLNENVEFNFPAPIAKKTNVGNILEKEVDEKYTISDKLWAGHRRRKEKNKLNGKGFGYGIFDENSLYTNTISSRYYKDGSEILIRQESKNPRKITPRETARLQGFPDSFIIPVSDVQAYKQFGNSVSVNVIEAISKEIIRSLS